MYSFIGKWITNDDFYSLEFIKKPNQNHKSTLLQNQHILFRDYFDYDNDKKIYLYYSADDLAIVFINGKFVDFGPAISYPFKQYYVKKDITKYVKKGNNSIVFHSYYQGLINRAYYSGDLRHGIIFDIRCDNKILCCSKTSTKNHLHTGYSISHIAGWISENDFNYDTDYIENYDSNCLEDKYYLPNFDDSKWNNSKERKYVDYKFQKLKIKSLKYEELNPRKINNDNLFDLKQEVVGYPYLIIRGQKGQIINIKCAEELNDDGEIRFDERCNCRYIEKWTLSGDIDTFVPYTYKAFRYIKIESNLPFELIKIKIIARHYPFKDKYKYHSDNKKLNQIYKLAKNTIKYGVQDSFLDCPSREKGQYFGDGVYSSLTHILLTKDDSLYKKFIIDAFSSMKIDKCMTAQGPCSYYQTIAEFPLYIVISLKYYLLLTGNKKFVDSQFINVKKLINAYKKKYFNEKDQLISVYDRWNVVEWPQSARDGYDFNLPQHGLTIGYHNVMNAFWIWAIKICDELYNDTFGINLKSIENSYLIHFFDEKRKMYIDSINSHHVSLPSMIMGCLLNINKDEQAKNNLIEMIKLKGLTCSNLFMTPLMFLFLKNNHQEQLLNQLILDKDGWLNMIKEGATTTFEAFYKDKKWNTSLLHTMFSFVILFMN